MKKTDIIQSFYNDLKLSKQEAKNLIDLILVELTKGIVGEGVEIRGFGSFCKRQRKGRLGINPKTGDKVWIKERCVPFFKPSKLLRNIVNNS